MPETGIVCAGRRGNMMGNGAARLFAPRKATLFFCRNIYTRGVFRRLRSEGDWGRAESPQCARRRNPLPRWGSDAPTPARKKGLQPYGALYCFGRRSEDFQRASGKPFGAPAGAYPLPRRGMTRRLRRGLGLAVPRGAHTFLSVAKEKCAKESQRHGDSGKKPFIAHFGGGARYVARSGVGQLPPTIVRARSSPFSAVKMGGPFSLRCLSPLCSPAVGGWQAHPLQVEMLRCGRKVLRRG